MQIKYPDYNRSTFSLISSVLKHYGVSVACKTIPELDSLLLKNYKNVVLMLFDGMCTSILENNLLPEAFLRNSLSMTISSVFPPTTTAATITMETGLSPIEHGWLGWSLYFDEIGSSVSIFPNTITGTKGQKAAGYHVAQEYLPYKSVFEKISESNPTIKSYCVSPFSSFKSKSVNGICTTVEKLCDEEGGKYIYTYWHQPDYDMHDYGTKHKGIVDTIKQINDEVEALCGKLDDTLVIVTADHGLVDTEWRYIPDYPDFEECLLRMPSIELRAMTFFVKPDKKDKFEELFIKYFGDIYKLFTKEQVINGKLFGNGLPHQRSYGFIGDYLAVATSNISIECRASTKGSVLKAAHAGVTEDEVNVPLIVVECK